MRCQLCPYRSEHHHHNEINGGWKVAQTAFLLPEKLYSLIDLYSRTRSGEVMQITRISHIPQWYTGHEGKNQWKRLNLFYMFYPCKNLNIEDYAGDFRTILLILCNLKNLRPSDPLWSSGEDGGKQNLWRFSLIMTSLTSSSSSSSSNKH